MAPRTHLAIQDVTKGFGPNAVLSGISLDVAEGEFVALIGPSGCGKSTLLRLVSGLDAPDTGRIAIGGRDVTDLRAADRDVAMVFQSYALYPHLTARQNMALPLVMRRMSAAQRLPLLGPFFGSRAAARAIAAEVDATAAALKIAALLDRKPSQMSGGQRQRVALGRAMVRHPRVFLMDEPLSNLDVALRVHMRGELVDLHRRLGVTTVYVTHDQAEALSMADRIAVLMGGRLLQIDAPEALYRDPHHIDVAEFVGTPKINVLAGEIDPAGTARIGAASLAWGFRGAGAGPVRLAVRPEHLKITTGTDSGAFPARLDRLEFQGSELLAHLGTEAGEALILRLPPGSPVPAPGSVVAIRAAPESWLAFDRQGHRVRQVAAAIPVPAFRAVRAHG